MSKRDEPAFPCQRDEDWQSCDPDWCGLTKFEHTVIEMAQGARISDPGWDSDDVVSVAVDDANAVWDAIEALEKEQP